MIDVSTIYRMDVATGETTPVGTNIQYTPLTEGQVDVSKCLLSEAYKRIAADGKSTVTYLHLDGTRVVRFRCDIIDVSKMTHTGEDQS